MGRRGRIGYKRDAGMNSGEIVRGARDEHRFLCWYWGRDDTDGGNGCLMCRNVLNQLLRVIKEADVAVIRASQKVSARRYV